MFHMIESVKPHVCLKGEAISQQEIGSSGKVDILYMEHFGMYKVLLVHVKNCFQASALPPIPQIVKSCMRQSKQAQRNCYINGYSNTFGCTRSVIANSCRYFKSPHPVIPWSKRFRLEEDLCVLLNGLMEPIVRETESLAEILFLRNVKS